jgi:hypothetical protein
MPWNTLGRGYSAILSNFPNGFQRTRKAPARSRAQFHKEVQTVPGAAFGYRAPYHRDAHLTGTISTGRAPRHRIVAPNED